MFAHIAWFHLSLTVNFKGRIAAFVLMKTNFITLALKQIILFSFEMYDDIGKIKDIAMVTIKLTS